jgi:DNA recombination-dependent growth factor C
MTMPIHQVVALMRGETIILPEQVVKKLDEKIEKMKQAKNSAQANKQDGANNEH